MKSRRKYVKGGAPKFFAVLATVLLFTLSLTGCGLFPKSKAMCQVTYSDGTKDCILEGREGDHYKLTVLPEKRGYTFAGLYDEETDGKQHVNANGESVLPYGAGKNYTVRLYARFEPKRYTVELDYNGALAPSGDTIAVTYNDKLPALPARLSLTGKDFAGWYTQPNGGGVQAADPDGNTQAYVNHNNFTLDDEHNVLRLYAHFTVTLLRITFRDTNGSTIKTVQAEYGSYLADAANAVRVNGMGVLSWDADISGKVTQDTELVAREYAPVIEFDCRGGYGAVTVIARAGSPIVLPVPEKACSDFLHWADASGQPYTASVMPQQSVRLRAVWQPKILLDSNGGSDVSDITAKAGASVTLPTPHRSGYTFAGWYTQNGDVYTTTVMPEEGISLKAGWCRTKTQHIDFRTGSEYYYVESSSKYCKVDLTALGLPARTTDVHVKLHFQALHYSGSNIAFNGFNDLLVGFYSQATTNAQYALCQSKRLPHDKVKDYRVYNIEQDLTVPDGIFYAAFTCGSINNGVKVKDCYIEITYPDYTDILL